MMNGSDRHTLRLTADWGLADAAVKVRGQTESEGGRESDLSANVSSLGWGWEGRAPDG